MAERLPESQFIPSPFRSIYEAIASCFNALLDEVAVQPTPSDQSTGDATLSITELLTKVITGTPTAACAYTLDTGALCDAGGAFIVNDYFDWVLINLATTAAYTITLTASAGHTIVGNPLVSSQSAQTWASMSGVHGTPSALFRTRKTATDTFVTYRIA